MQVSHHVTAERVNKPAKRISAAATKKAPRQTPKIEISAFRKLYDRGDFPVCVNYDARGNQIKWKVDPQTLDYHYYLPLFFTGLLEIKDPYAFLVYQGIRDMLSVGGEKVVACVPQLILPLKQALNTKNTKVCVTVMKVLQEMVEDRPEIGQAIVPYYRQLLPVFSQLKNKNVHLGDGIYYAQRKGENLGDVIEETLNKLEISGGRDAFANIKYMVPTYESCVIRH